MRSCPPGLFVVISSITMLVLVSILTLHRMNICIDEHKMTILEPKIISKQPTLSDIAFNSTQNQISICILIRVNTLDPFEYLLTLLWTLRSQSLTNISFNIFLFSSRGWQLNFTTDQILKLNDLFIQDISHYFRISVANNLTNLNQTLLNANTNYTFGYYMTNEMLKFVIEHNKQKYKCKYFLFTNSDNQYHRDWLKTINKSMIDEVDLIGVHWITHYPRWGTKHLTFIHPRFLPSPVDHMDLGAVLVSVRSIKVTNARFEYKRNSDGRFFEHILKHRNGKNISHILYKETLFLHQ
eukprot:381737_1